MGDLNLKSSTVEKSLDLVKGFLQKVVGPSVDELGLLFTDNIRLWRLKNQIRNLEKVKKIVDESNLTLKQVDLKVLVPYLEGVSLEDNEELQNVWANLFTNYIDSSKTLVSHVYPAILKQLSSEDVVILKHLEEHHVITTEAWPEPPGDDPDNRYEFRHLANLERLGLISPRLNIRTYDLGRIGGIQTEEELPQMYHLSAFGGAFLRACQR